MPTDLNALQPKHPSLYRLAADGLSLDFLFTQCPTCGHLVFPAHAPGCDACGDPLRDAAQLARPGGGTLLEFVTLHAPLLPGMELPRIAADIQITDEGLIEEGILAVSDESQLRVGMRLRAIAVARPGEETFDCRFIPELEPAR